MLPNNSLATVVEYSGFVNKSRLPLVKTIDYERGGIAIRDSSEGLSVQDWQVWLDGDDVMAYSPSNGEELLFTRPGVTELALSFDANMNPFVAFIQNGEAFIWWYDSLVAAQVFTSLGTGITNIRATLDDIREVNSANRDIIVAYNKSGNLYYRQQRDRYSTERLLKSESLELDAIGMGKNLRLQFRFQPDDPFPFIYTWDNFIRYDTGTDCAQAPFVGANYQSAVLKVYEGTGLEPTYDSCGVAYLATDEPLLEFDLGIGQANATENGWIEIDEPGSGVIRPTAHSNIWKAYAYDTRQLQQPYTYVFEINADIAFADGAQENMTFRGVTTYTPEDFNGEG